MTILRNKLEREKSDKINNANKDRQAIHVLSVDDSAVVREMMSCLLPDANGLTLDVAADPVIATRKIAQRRPDVILLDLEMPRMDGLSFMRELMAKNPIPVVICSGYAARGTDIALQALSEGAFEILSKPKRGVADFLEKSVAEFRTVLREAAKSARPKSRTAGATLQAVPSRRLATIPPPDRTSSGQFSVVAIGTSTGGPTALNDVLGKLTPNCPGIVVVQHMPPNFTAALARRLDWSCQISVREALHGDLVAPGTALIAPGDRHLMLVRRGAHLSVALADGPEVNGHKPSVDVLFKSVALAAGSRACGVILTGMGADGAVGLAVMRAAGATTLGQSEASCAVYGMPQRAFELGAIERVVELCDVANAIDEDFE